MDSTSKLSSQKIRIAILGGGLVGSLAALSLARSLSNVFDLQIEVFERHAKPSDSTDRDYQKQYNARNLVVSSASVAFLKEIQVWSHLAPFLAPIETLHVSRLKGFGHSTIDSKEEGIPALGYVADMAKLALQFTELAQEHRSVQFHFNSELKTIKPVKSGYEICWSETGNQVSKFDLVVVADGQSSWACSSLGILSKSQKYDHSALVTNITLDREVPAVAYEQFIPGGALTLLPLTQCGFSRRMALVWIDQEERLHNLQTIADEIFLKILKEYLPIDAQFIERGISQVYPLYDQIREERVRPHLVIIGNAAQSLHPIAAQGFNLAVRDIRDFVIKTLEQQSKMNSSIFNGEWMNEFGQERSSDVSKVRGFVHSLTNVFFNSKTTYWRGIVQDLALTGFELMPGTKRALSKLAMGGRSRRISQ